MGDPSGIGPEIVIKSLKNKEILKLADFVVIGDSKVFNKSNGLENALSKKVRLLDLDNVSNSEFRFGKLSAKYGKASLEYIDKAIALIKAGVVDCLVTAPVSKEAVSLSGNKFIGHTEYLAGAFGSDNFVMMFVGEKLKVALVTRHLPLKRVSTTLTTSLICSTITLTIAALKKYFGIANPKIGICSLNPHNGEGGHLGREELDIILPAIERVQPKIGNICGPLSSESVFFDSFRGRYDAVVAMYHDQGLIPFKMLYRDTGVNLTLGLPFIRVSPDHGVAFDIAGKNIANPNSMLESIRLAIKCTSSLKKA